MMAGSIGESADVAGGDGCFFFLATYISPSEGVDEGLVGTMTTQNTIPFFEKKGYIYGYFDKYICKIVYPQGVY
jgi:hypothetical protein